MRGGARANRRSRALAPHPASAPRRSRLKLGCRCRRRCLSSRRGGGREARRLLEPRSPVDVLAAEKTGCWRRRSRLLRVGNSSSETRAPTYKTSGPTHMTRESKTFICNRYVISSRSHVKVAEAASASAWAGAAAMRSSRGSVGCGRRGGGSRVRGALFWPYLEMEVSSDTFAQIILGIVCIAAICAILFLLHHVLEPAVPPPKIAVCGNGPDAFITGGEDHSDANKTLAYFQNLSWDALRLNTGNASHKELDRESLVFDSEQKIYGLCSGRHLRTQRIVGTGMLGRDPLTDAHCKSVMGEHARSLRTGIDIISRGIGARGETVSPSNTVCGCVANFGLPSEKARSMGIDLPFADCGAIPFSESLCQTSTKDAARLPPPEAYLANDDGQFWGCSCASCGVDCWDVKANHCRCDIQGPMCLPIEATDATELPGDLKLFKGVQLRAKVLDQGKCSCPSNTVEFPFLGKDADFAFHAPCTGFLKRKEGEEKWLVGRENIPETSRNDQCYAGLELKGGVWNGTCEGCRTQGKFSYAETHAGLCECCNGIDHDCSRTPEAVANINFCKDGDTGSDNFCSDYCILGAMNEESPLCGSRFTSSATDAGWDPGLTPLEAHSLNCCPGCDGVFRFYDTYHSTWGVKCCKLNKPLPSSTRGVFLVHDALCVPGNDVTWPIKASEKSKTTSTALAAQEPTAG